MVYDPETWWVVAKGGRYLHNLLHPTEEAAMRALHGTPDKETGRRDGIAAQVERQRTAGWRVLRVRVVQDACSLCGEAWEEGHECPRETEG
jgi:hypothetical protein